MHVEIDGAQITGRWMDDFYAVTGTVGVATNAGFIIVPSGELFNAKVTVGSSHCGQSVTVVSERAEQMQAIAAVQKMSGRASAAARRVGPEHIGSANSPLGVRAQ